MRHWLHWYRGDADLPKQWYVEFAVGLHHRELWHSRKHHWLHDQFRRHYLHVFAHLLMRHRIHRHRRNSNLPSQRVVDFGIGLYYRELLFVADSGRLHDRGGGLHLWFDALDVVRLWLFRLRQFHLVPIQRHVVVCFRLLCFYLDSFHRPTFRREQHWLL